MYGRGVVSICKSWRTCDLIGIIVYLPELILVSISADPYLSDALIIPVDVVTFTLG